MGLFQKSVLKSYLSNLDDSRVKKAFEEYKNFFNNQITQQNIRNAKEEQFQEGFLRELFVKIMGYTINPDPDYNLTTEQKNISDSKKADGAIIINEKVTGIIELKGTNVIDLGKVQQQAFYYLSAHPEAVYVITFNFEKLRFYIQKSNEYEEFNLFLLSQDEFKLLYLCISYESISAGLPLKIKVESVLKEENITKQLYKDYYGFKQDLFRSLCQWNTDIDKLTLYKASQKLIDRFLFIFFCEDNNGLLPANSISEIIKHWNKLRDMDEYRPLYDIFKKYFEYINTGRAASGDKQEIFAYNGGLFSTDALLDQLKVDDHLLYIHTQKLSNYDFISEVDVNILGHIFEHSLNEIEEVQAELEGNVIDKSKTKRKKDGVFYTPKYITEYIVENTVGKLCNDKKAALGIDEDAYVSAKKANERKPLMEKLNQYKQYVLSLTICDPACGSGAFLNQAYLYLQKEHQYIADLESKLFDASITVTDVSADILENNLFGVDINEESVEIARLALWLRSAKKGRKLNNLSDNIKCGNSLIDDPTVAGDKAFKWEEEFPQVFRKKNKQRWHVVFALHGSRYSEHENIFREVGLVAESPIYLEINEEEKLAKIMADVAIEQKVNLIEWMICADHVHSLIICDEDELSDIIGKWKGKSAFLYNREVMGDMTEMDAIKSDGTKSKFWVRGSGKTHIESDEQYINTIQYIKNNRNKHQLPKASVGLTQQIERAKVTESQANKTEYKGGFDVVIGNPPYVRQELLRDIKPFLENNYKVYQGTTDLFAYFYEKSHLILKPGGLIGFISNTFDKTKAAINLREFIVKNTSILKYIDFTDVQIFDGATTYPVIFLLCNIKPKNQSFEYIKISKTTELKNIYIDGEYSQKFIQENLDSTNWNFENDEISNLILKLKKHSVLKETFGKSFRGIVTGFNEAFIINKDTKISLIAESESSAALIKPFYEGKDISKWKTPEIEKYLIFTRRGTDINKYPAIKNYLLKYKTNLTPRNSDDIITGRKPGPYKWFEIQDSVDYYKIFESPKIIWPNLQATNKFCLDDTGYYINAPSVVLPSNNKTLLCILNSKLIWQFLKSICVVRSGGYIEVKPQYFEQIPVPPLSNEAIFNALADKMILYNESIQVKQSKFISRIQSNFHLDNITGKLEKFYEYDFKSFLGELKKQKVILSLKEQDEWEDYFNSYKHEISILQGAIAKTDKEIDQMVYELYELTEEEIRIVELG